MIVSYTFLNIFIDLITYYNEAVKHFSHLLLIYVYRRVLITTHIWARGIDVQQVSLVTLELSNVKTVRPPYSDLHGKKPLLTCTKNK